MTDISAASATDTIYEAFLPSEADVVSYEERGWYKSPRVIPSELLDEVRDAIMAHQSGVRDRPIPRPARFHDWRPGDGDGLRSNGFCSLQNDTVRKLVTFPLIGAIAARLARSAEVRLFDDQAVYAPQGAPQAEEAGWHTDEADWATCTSTRMLTVWIPFEDTSAASGTLRLVEGSHTWGRSAACLGRSIRRARVTQVALRKGEVSFHHMRTLHCDPPGRANTPRLALAIHVQDAENRYRPFTTPWGKRVVLPHDELCRRNPAGMPDYADPQIFPTLWRHATQGPCNA